MESGRSTQDWKCIRFMCGCRNNIAQQWAVVTHDCQLIIMQQWLVYTTPWTRGTPMRDQTCSLIQFPQCASPHWYYNTMSECDCLSSPQVLMQLFFNELKMNVFHFLNHPKLLLLLAVAVVGWWGINNFPCLLNNTVHYTHTHTYRANMPFTRQN